MTYQFERSEIKQCQNCDFAFGGGNLKINERYCSRQDEIIDGYKKPQENDCPLVAISKTETTSCEWCDKTLMLFTKSGKYIPENQPPRNYCPNCGRKIKEEEQP